MHYNTEGINLNVDITIGNQQGGNLLDESLTMPFEYYRMT